MLVDKIFQVLQMLVVEEEVVELEHQVTMQIYLIIDQEEVETGLRKSTGVVLPFHWHHCLVLHIHR
jgi:hypothetical protein